MSLWASPLTFLCLGFSIYKMKTIIEGTFHKIVVKIKGVKH